MTMENSSNVAQSSKWKLSIMIAGFVIVVALVFYFVFEGTKNDITIVNAGEKIESRTHAKTVSEALDEAGIKVSERDEIAPGKNAEIKDGMEIKYLPARQITINDNGTKKDVWSTKANVADLLKDENITTRPQDVLNVALDTKLKNGLEVNINRAIQLSLQNGAKKDTVWTTKTKVSDLLAEKNIKLDQDDRVSPAKDSNLKEKMTVEVTYVNSKAEKKNEQVKFETVYKEDDSLNKGVEKVVQEGKNGKKVVEYKVTFENGKEKKRDVIKENVTSNKTDKVVVRGTKEKVVATPVSNVSTSSATSSSSSSASSTPSGGKTYKMESTAYSGGGTTAYGINLSANPGLKVIAVDPRIIPLGSKVWVEGYGEAIAGDTGGAIKGNIVDVYFPNESQCYSWGRRMVTVKVLN
ncbi:resuscitation-promoting factor [Listeria monocytogenes]|uniref:resuscitation-promoting factor n=1 Tax=Listeria monocytogenes TaxID=1639 RepID=UPI00175F605A|nr:resuscitation-promoting factor [Listeria monocytogenes]MBK3709494.1 resuscitation-promoting factor [Listeria monocytogenes]MCE8155977.1 resuscitation-promoting factor [Listeria monocytogenes]MCP7504058.1 resuscitation-promoting factor [Listeria monocytogenes]MCP7509879.1 resuscitation-promoting factor [Listeria monocytogenes]MCP7954164.1 resuscitation-promoting factor [Listeria monocytogenes]